MVHMSPETLLTNMHKCVTTTMTPLHINWTKHIQPHSYFTVTLYWKWTRKGVKDTRRVPTYDLLGMNMLYWVVRRRFVSSSRLWHIFYATTSFVGYCRNIFGNNYFSVLWYGYFRNKWLLFIYTGRLTLTNSVNIGWRFVALISFWLSFVFTFYVVLVKLQYH